MTQFAFLISLLISAPPGDAEEGLRPDAPPTPAQLQFFEKEVKPILKASCFECHGSKGKPKAGLRLSSRARTLKGGESGPAVSLKKPQESLLLEAINYEGFEMPPKGKLPQAQIDVLTRWVRMGLPWTPSENDEPEDEETITSPQVTPETKQFWSFQPVRRPELPQVEAQQWVKTPIDAFILSRLETADLKPAEPATKAALIRRVYYNLIGLPPSPAEVEAFLTDESPQAFETVVDRLLESPHYGEKWGRHWLDLVRYAESDSYERDNPKPNVWRYRDYVIRSLNDDKPFDRFLVEQLAGDELSPSTHETLIATGFYRLGIWQDEPVDRLQALYDDLDDILTVTSQVFLGLRINCARCHDHKLDPIPQEDYYRMLSFFNGVTRYGVRDPKTIAKNSLRSIGTPEQEIQQADEIAAHRLKVNENALQIKLIEDIVRPDFIPVEKEEFRNRSARIAIVKKRVPKLLSEKEFAEYERLFKQREELNRFKPSALDLALCVTEVGPTPRETHLLIRGNPHSKGKMVQPGFPAVLDLPDPLITPPASNASSSGRRLALAKWIAEKNNPLTARVMVNRIWQYHFGRGIVRSPNNFGMQGTPPTHPALLDWLADEFVEGGWRLKHLHKLIVLSSAYQMSSHTNAAAYRKDPENDLFWKFDMRRLTAEEVRDSILAVNGSLNRRKMFGPSIYPIIPKEVLAGQSQPGNGWGNSSPEDRARRSVYIHVKRSLVTPILASFDAADTDTSCPVRFSTTQPTQALGMLNSDFANQQAGILAEFLRKKTDGSIEHQVRLCLQRVLQREPETDEIERGIDLIDELQNNNNVSPEKALSLFCLIALNMNEFFYLD